MTLFQVRALPIIEKKFVLWILNWNGVEGSVHGMYYGSIPSVHWEWGKLQNALASIADLTVRFEVRTVNVNQECSLVGIREICTLDLEGGES